MKHVLEKFTPYLYALMRIVAGLLYACHGAQKLYGVLGGFGGQPGATAALFSLMGLAGIIEFFGGLSIAFGFLTHYTAFIASGEMAAAYFRQHAPRGFWPIQNGGDLRCSSAFCFSLLPPGGPDDGVSWAHGPLGH